MQQRQSPHSGDDEGGVSCEPPARFGDNLAMMFSYLNPDVARSWMRQAAEAGFEPAQQALDADPSEPAAT